MKLHELLTFARQSKGITQKDLARKMGITANALSMYEKGYRQRDISVSVYIKWCTALNINSLKLLENIIEEDLIKL